MQPSATRKNPITQFSAHIFKNLILKVQARRKVVENLRQADGGPASNRNGDLAHVELDLNFWWNNLQIPFKKISKIIF